MKQFKIKAGGFSEIKKAIVIRAVPLALIASIGGLAISHFSGNGQNIDSSNYLIMTPLILCALAFGIFRSIKQQKEIFDSYTLTVSDNTITRVQHNTSTISINYTDVSEIIKNKNKSFTIKGSTAVDIIGIPSQIEAYDQLENMLIEIKPITVKTKEPLLQKYTGLLPILVLGLMAVVYISNNKFLVGASGIILLAGIGYALFESQRSKSIDNKTKKRMWWVILVAFSILGSMFFKLIK